MEIVDVKPLSLRQNTIYNAIGCLAYQGFQWLITVLVVTLSSDYANSGILAYAMTIGNMFSSIALYSARAFQVSDTENKYSQSNYIAFRFITIFLAGAACIIYTLVITQSMASVVVVLLYLLFKADETFAAILYGADQKACRMDYIGISQFIRGVLSVSCFVGVLYYSQSLALAVLSMFVSCFLVTLIYDLPHTHRFGSIVPRINKNQARALLKSLFPAMVANVLCGLVVSVARQYFSIGYGDEALGIYAAVATPSVLVQLAASYLYSPAIGPLASRWNNGTRTSFIRYLFKIILVMLLLIAILIIVLSCIGDPLLQLVYGDSIADYTFLFPYALIATGMVVFMWFSSDLFVIFRDFKAVLISNSVAFIATLVCMVPFIHLWYMNGISITIIVSYTLGLIVAAFMMRKRIFLHYK